MLAGAGVDALDPQGAEIALLGALDTETGEEILRLLRARCDAGAAGVMVTHEARHAAWADRVVFLRDGVVVDETGADDPEELLAEAQR